MLLGFTLYSGTFFAGGLVGPAYRFWDLVGLMIVGNLILGSYAAALAYIATLSGNAIALRAGSRGAASLVSVSGRSATKFPCAGIIVYVFLLSNRLHKTGCKAQYAVNFL